MKGYADIIIPDALSSSCSTPDKQGHFSFLTSIIPLSDYRLSEPVLCFVLDYKNWVTY